MTNWFDSHGHLNDERFDEDRESLIERLPSLGVGAMVVVGYDKDPARCALPVAKKAPWLYAALGVHPHEAEDWTDEIEEDLIRQCKDEKVVALGEIGLDYHYDFSPRDVQKRVFARQIELAKRLALPIVVHMREATADTLSIIRAAGEIPGGIMHCFGGSVETARELLDRGWYISFSGTLTFNNAERLRAVAETIPADRMLVETDCPYLAPVPMRGKRNQPDFVQYTGRVAAACKKMEEDEFAALTMQNAKRVFGIKE